MSSVDYVVIAVVAVIIGLAVYKIVRDKKRGAKCSGCGVGCECGCSSECSEESHK